ncbi:MAG TPA: SDR family oxidoreductase [Aquifex aeolicus]|nr:SDR family oxidoreductase [Aquifex aeolicus]
MAKVAIITGIRRIGKEIGKSLIDKGYNLTVVYNSSKSSAEDLKAYAKEKGVEVLLLKADLRNYENFSEIVNETIKEFGRIDAFIHLASPYVRKNISENTREDLYHHFVPIAEAFYFISLECYKEMLKNEGEIKGHILAFGDWATNISPYKGFSTYFIAKGALHTAVKVLAKEFAPYVPVNCIALGPVIKAENYTDEEWEKIIRGTPLKRNVSLNDIIKLTELLLETDSITGEIIMVDGGRHIAGSGV